MKVIVAGSRDCSDYDLVSEAITEGLEELKIEITELVSGGAAGVDKTGELWAKQHDVNIVTFIPKWKDIKAEGAVIKENKYGKYNANAGFARNAEMADYADALIAIDLNTNGTNNMIKVAKEKGLKVFCYSPKPLSDEEFDYVFGSEY